jgi:ribonuclease HI
MQAASPHYLLFSEASGRADQRRHWRFVLRSVATDQCLAAADVEPETDSGRLELLAVVRGLEALDQPSRVTLLTRSRYVSRGIRRGLGQWRDRQWRWERFGRLVPIRDHDLWRRVDRALRIHRVECCPWGWGEPQLPQPGAAAMAGTDFAEERGEAAVLIVPRRRGSGDGPGARPTNADHAWGVVPGRCPLDPSHPAYRRRGFARVLVRLGRAASVWLAAACRRPAFTRAA